MLNLFLLYFLYHIPTICLLSFNFPSSPCSRITLDVTRYWYFQILNFRLDAVRWRVFTEMPFRLYSAVFILMYCHKHCKCLVTIKLNKVNPSIYISFDFCILQQHYILINFFVLSATQICLLFSLTDYYNYNNFC